MMSWMPKLAIPLHMVAFRGVSCCPAMNAARDLRTLAKHRFCYEARNFRDANVAIIFGSLSPLMMEEVQTSLSQMAPRKVVCLFRGCEKRVDNQWCMDPSPLLHPDIVFNNCQILALDKNFLAQVRVCLKV
jgi:hypothetical protein